MPWHGPSKFSAWACMLEKLHWGPSIKYVTLFLANFYPIPCHTLSHIPRPPKSTSHISDPPIFFSRPSTKNPDKSPLYKFSLNCWRGFCPGDLSEGLLSGRFCPGWFLSIPPSVKVHVHPLQQKVKDHFEFHVSYNDKKIYKCDVTCSLPPPSPCHKLSHLLGSPPPLAWRTLWTAPIHIHANITTAY